MITYDASKHKLSDYFPEDQRYFNFDWQPIVLDDQQVQADFNDAAAVFNDHVHHVNNQNDLAKPSDDIVYFGFDNEQGWANYD